MKDQFVNKFVEITHQYYLSQLSTVLPESILSYFTDNSSTVDDPQLFELLGRMTQMNGYHNIDQLLTAMETDGVLVDEFRDSVINEPWR